MPGPTLLFIGPFDQLPRKAASERASEEAAKSWMWQRRRRRRRSKIKDTRQRDRDRETSEFKIDVLTFRPEGSIFVQTDIEENPSPCRLLGSS